MRFWNLISLRKSRTRFYSDISRERERAMSSRNCLRSIARETLLENSIAPLRSGNQALVYSRDFHIQQLLMEAGSLLCDTIGKSTPIYPLGGVAYSVGNRGTPLRSRPHVSSEPSQCLHRSNMSLRQRKPACRRAVRGTRYAVHSRRQLV